MSDFVISTEQVSRVGSGVIGGTIKKDKPHLIMCKGKWVKLNLEIYMDSIVLDGESFKSINDLKRNW